MQSPFHIRWMNFRDALWGGTARLDGVAGAANTTDDESVPVAVVDQFIAKKINVDMVRIW